MKGRRGIVRVILIDDEIVALNALKKRVDWVKYGFTEVLTAQDADTARSLLEKHPVDLVVSDIEMPGESGLSLIENIKENNPVVECIFVTCHARFDFIKKAMKFKVWDYILKPIDYEEFENLMLQFSEYKQRSREKESLEKIVEKAQAGKPGAAVYGEERLTAVKEYIEDHIQEQIYINDLAKLIHVNSQYLMRIFKKESGQSITEYITGRRIVIASNLLKETSYTINFIADCVGCENYSYFTKLFKRNTGYTPSEYRAMYKTKKS